MMAQHASLVDVTMHVLATEGANALVNYLCCTS
jgi:hypothetical protein